MGENPAVKHTANCSYFMHCKYPSRAQIPEAFPAVPCITTRAVYMKKYFYMLESWHVRFPLTPTGVIMTPSHFLQPPGSTLLQMSRRPRRTTCRVWFHWQFWASPKLNTKMHLLHRVRLTFPSYHILHCCVLIQDTATLQVAVSHHFTNCWLAFIPDTRNIHWNADIHNGNGEEVHRQLIQRRRKGMKQQKSSVKDNVYCHRNDCTYGSET